MKLVLMGTNDWVVPVFESLRHHEILAVFTRAPAIAGRKMILTKSPVHIWADSHDIPVLTNIFDYNFAPDFNVVASYGVILRDDVLSAARTINIHPSDLPKYRGPSPMLSAIKNGDTQTAVCLMNLTSLVDAGDVYIRREINIGQNDTICDLEKTVSDVSIQILSDFFADQNLYPGFPQTGTPIFSNKFRANDTIIDWNKTAIEIHNQVRSIGGRTKISELLSGGNNTDIKIIQTELIDDKLRIIRVLPSGKKSMLWSDFLRGQSGHIINKKIENAI